MQGNEDGTWGKERKGISTGETRGLCMNGEISLINLADHQPFAFCPREKGEIEVDVHCGVIMLCTGYMESCGE